MILIDSCEYIKWLKQGKAPFTVLRPLIQTHEVASCGIIRVEVLRGIVNPNMKTDMECFFDVIPEIPCHVKLWAEVTELAWKLDRKGIVLPLTDLIIGACALKIGATIITSDTHFKKIPHLKVRANL